MNILPLCGHPATELARALADFEAQFTYPLGPGRTFRISHGDDYPRFFRAMGEATCFVAEEQGRVVGSLGVAVRRLLLPNGSDMPVAYLGDLKVDPTSRKSFVFFQLAWAAEAWVHEKTSAGFGVVMDGTRITPDAYTGHCGIPAGRMLGQVLIWQFPCPCGSAVPGDQRFLSTREQTLDCFRRLSRGRYASISGSPDERSEMPPIWLLHPEGLASGLVEDTRRAKRLLANDGSELRSGHLSFFACLTPGAGAELIAVARRCAALWGHPALFVAIPTADGAELAAVLTGVDKVVAPATIYGGRLDDGPAWNINSSEI